MFRKLVGNPLIFPAALAILAALFLSVNLNKPFIGQHDYNGAQEGNAAKNYLRYGVFNLKFGQVIHSVNLMPDGKLSPDQSYYTTYLPMAPLLITLSFWVFGVSEWAERLVPLLFSILGVAFLYLIAAKLWNKQTALLAAIFYIFTPMFLYYGKMPVPEPLIIAMALACFYIYLCWLEKRSGKTLAILCAALFFTGLIGWPIVYFAPLLILHSLLTKKFSWRLLIPGVVLASTVLLQFAHEYYLTGKLAGSYMLSTLQMRLAEENLNFGGVDFNPANYLRQEISWLQAYFTRVLLVFSGIGLVVNLGRKINLRRATLIFWLLFGLAHPVIFSRMVFIHDYLNFYLLPFLSFSGALGLLFIAGWLRKLKISRSTVAVFVSLAVFVFITERLEFTKALLRTEMNEPGLQMAQLLNGLQESPNEAVILSERFNDFYGIFSQFYSRYPFGMTSEEGLEKSANLGEYKYIITINEDITDRGFYQQLVSRYRSEKTKDITVIFTDEKK